MPAASKARLSAASVAGIGRRWPLSNLNIVDAATSERCPRSAIRQPSAARAILLCADVIVIGAFYEPVMLDATRVMAYHFVTGLTISPVSGSTRCLQRRAEPDQRRLVFEMRVVLESVSHGLEALQALPEAVLIKEQLGVLRKLTMQAAEALETFSEIISPRPADS